MSKVTLDDIFSILVNTQNTLLSMKDDINRLDKKIDAVEARLNKKIDAVEAKLNKKIDTVEARLNKKIDAVEASLNKKIDTVEASLNKKIDTVEARLNKKIDAVEASLNKKIDTVEARLNQKIYNTKIELTNLIKAESEKIEEKVGNEINDLCILINDTITPDLNEVRSIAIFLKPNGYVSVHEDSQKYKVN